MSYAKYNTGRISTPGGFGAFPVWTMTPIGGDARDVAVPAEKTSALANSGFSDVSSVDIAEMERNMYDALRTQSLNRTSVREGTETGVGAGTGSHVEPERAVAMREINCTGWSDDSCVEELNRCFPMLSHTVLSADETLARPPILRRGFAGDTEYSSLTRAVDGLTYDYRDMSVCVNNLQTRVVSQQKQMTEFIDKVAVDEAVFNRIECLERRLRELEDKAGDAADAGDAGDADDAGDDMTRVTVTVPKHIAAVIVELEKTLSSSRKTEHILEKMRKILN
jgi:hypothetical protein